jgi:hypothetical protein
MCLPGGHPPDTEELTFRIVPFRSGYHALLGREAFIKFHDVPHYGYMKLKMSGPNGVITVTSNPERALRAENKTASLALESLAEAFAAEELTVLQTTVNSDDIILDKRSTSTSFKRADEIVKFQVHPIDPNKTASIVPSWTQKLTKPFKISFKKTGTYSPGILQTCPASQET